MNKGLSQFAENGLKWLSILDADESKRRVWNEQVLVPVEGQSLDALFALAAEQDETKPCTCGQPDCPFADTGPVQVGIVGGEVMEFGKQRGVTQIPF